MTLCCEAIHLPDTPQACQQCHSSADADPTLPPPPRKCHDCYAFRWLWQGESSWRMHPDNQLLLVKRTCDCQHRHSCAAVICLVECAPAVEALLGRSPCGRKPPRRCKDHQPLEPHPNPRSGNCRQKLGRSLQTDPRSGHSVPANPAPLPLGLDHLLHQAVVKNPSSELCCDCPRELQLTALTKNHQRCRK